MENDSIKALLEKRTKLGTDILKLVEDFQSETGHLLGHVELKMVNTPKGLYQDLRIDVDTFDDMKPKPQSNIITPDNNLKIQK